MILAAVRARRVSAAMLLALAAIAAAVTAEAPWYGLAVASRAAAAHVAAAPPAQRVLSATTTGTAGAAPGPALSAFADLLHRQLPIGAAVPVVGLVRSAVYAPNPGGASGFPAAYRDGFCEHMRLTGSCPETAGQAAVSRDAARRTGLAVGDVFTVRAAPSTRPVRFRVVALYDLADPAGDYWSDPSFAANAALDPFFTGLDSFADPQLSDPTLTAAVTVPAALLRGDGGYDLNAVLNAAVPRLQASGVTVTNPTGTLLDAVGADRAGILRAVLVALAQLVVLAWFAIGLAGRYTSQDRTADAGQLKLRGSTRPRILGLAVGQHVVPLAGAAIIALPAGVAVAWLLAGGLPVAADVRLALGLSAAAVAVVLAGCLLVLAVVDAGVLRRPVTALLRRVPPARRGWRRDVTDLALIALAAGAAYQARTGGSGRGLAIAAPALMALGVAVVLARLLRVVADRAGAVAVRRGRLRVGLTAVGVSRQPGADRVLVLLVVVVALLALAIGGYAAGRSERADRSAFELGAARVLTVRAAGWTALEYAVRHADPGGRQAMAAVVNRTSNPPILAVDSSRLAAVGMWRPEYGPVRALAGGRPGPTAAAAGHRHLPGRPRPQRPEHRRRARRRPAERADRRAGPGGVPSRAAGAADPLGAGGRLHHRTGLPARPLGAGHAVRSGVRRRHGQRAGPGPPIRRTCSARPNSVTSPGGTPTSPGWRCRSPQRRGVCPCRPRPVPAGDRWPATPCTPSRRRFRFRWCWPARRRARGGSRIRPPPGSERAPYRSGWSALRERCRCWDTPA